MFESPKHLLKSPFRIKTKQRALSLSLFLQRDILAWHVVHTFGLGRCNADIYNVASFSFAEVKVYLMQKCPVCQMAIGQLKRIARCPNCYCIDPGMQQGCSKTVPKINIIGEKFKSNSPKIQHLLENKIETDRTLTKLLLHRSRHAARLLFQNPFLENCSKINIIKFINKLT